MPGYGKGAPSSQLGAPLFIALSQDIQNACVVPFNFAAARLRLRAQIIRTPQHLPYGQPVPSADLT